MMKEVKHVTKVEGLTKEIMIANERNNKDIILSTSQNKKEKK